MKEGADAIDTSAALDARDSDVLAVTVRVVLAMCEDFFVQVFSHVLLIAGEANPTKQVPEPRHSIPSAVTLEEARVVNAKVDNAC